MRSDTIGCESPEVVGHVVALATALLAGDAACLSALLASLGLDPGDRATGVALGATRCLVSALRLLVDGDDDATQSALAALALRAACAEAAVPAPPP